MPRKRWAWMLAHVFQADMDHCPRCSGPMRWAEVATTRAAITRLLAEHDPGKSLKRDGLGARAPPPQRANLRVPEQMVLGFGEG